MAEISPRVKDNLERWFEHGISPGHFLTAVLCNDLRQAVALADDENIRVLPEIVTWIRDHAPLASWGSPAAVNHWRFSKRRVLREPQADHAPQ